LLPGGLACSYAKSPSLLPELLVKSEPEVPESLEISVELEEIGPPLELISAPINEKSVKRGPESAQKLSDASSARYLWRSHKRTEREAGQHKGGKGWDREPPHRANPSYLDDMYLQSEFLLTSGLTGGTTFFARSMSQSTPLTRKPPQDSQLDVLSQTSDWLGGASSIPEERV
jgi:hypothetical protein